MTNNNFVVKTTDAKLVDLQKALQAAGIKVRSIIEIFKEDTIQEENKET
jgi:hypothetical protein